LIVRPIRFLGKLIKWCLILALFASCFAMPTLSGLFAFIFLASYFDRKDRVARSERTRFERTLPRLIFSKGRVEALSQCPICESACAHEIQDRTNCWNCGFTYDTSGSHNWPGPIAPGKPGGERWPDGGIDGAIRRHRRS
jgi:hypothetical protein